LPRRTLQEHPLTDKTVPGLPDLIERVPDVGVKEVLECWDTGEPHGGLFGLLLVADALVADSSQVIEFVSTVFKIDKL
jgi:hypothetical protein